MYIKRKVGGQKQAGPRHCSLVVVVSCPCHWLIVVVPFVVGAVGWWWWSHCCWLMVVVPFVGGCSWTFVVGVGGWWWCSCRHVGGAGHSSLFVGGAAGHSTLVVCVVIGRQSPLVFGHCCSLFIVVRHCASFVGVVVIWRHFVLHGDVAADVSAGLPIGEG